MSNDPKVEAVVADVAMGTDAIQSLPNSPATGGWGLDRIDQRDRNYNGQFRYNNTGAGVHVYIMDTGVFVGHSDFGGRASLDYSAVNGKSPDDDANYSTHGTSVASIVGGTTFGVAKNVRLHSIKVIEARSNPTGKDPVYISAAAKGFDWILNNAQKPAVVNCSFGGKWLKTPFNEGADPMNKALRRVILKGIPVVVSAGNDYGDDAIRHQPSNMWEAICVGASTRTDSRADFSNVGGVIDVFAPGDPVDAAGWEIVNGRKVEKNKLFNGTSAAAPFVTGVVAQYLQSNPNVTTDQVQDFIRNSATQGRLTGLPSGTPNRLLYTDR